MGLQRAFIITGFFLFFTTVQMVTLYGCYYSFQTVKKKIRIAAIVYILFLNLSNLFLFNRYPLLPWLKTLITYILIYPYFIYMLLSLSLFPLFIISGIYILFKKAFLIFRPPVPVKIGSEIKFKKADPADRRKFLKLMTSTVLLPASSYSLYGSYFGRNKLKIEEHRLSFANLPDNIDGLSIVQISDIHAGVFMEDWELEPVIHMVNELQPDLVVITGDIISWGSAYIKPVVEVLGKLKAAIGVYAIMGNHDFYSDIERLCNNLERVNITVLRNRWEKTDLPKGSPSLYLIGIDDIWATRYFKKKTISLKDILSGIPQESFKLLLSHNPTIFDAAAGHGIHLTLSGHTHGGQIILPFPEHHGYSLARLIYQRDYGLYCIKDSLLYINRGLGVIGPPLRINCPREISKIILKAAE